MALIPFEDLPSTNTPLNATNLNYNFNEVLNLICPVGKVEVFFDNNDHSNYLGFTWQRTCVGRTPVGIDTTQTEFDTIGETGGYKDYTIGESNLPWSVPIRKNASGDGFSQMEYGLEGWQWYSNNNFSYGQPIPILQPYQVVAFWKRTA
jgi:hypothetical protein